MNRHFLIIDDDEDDLTLLVEILEMLEIPHQYTWAKSGEQGLRQLAFITPDLIFLDYQMTGMNGLQCLEAIKGISTCKKIPVLLHSSKMDHQLEIKGLQLGAAACFNKAYSLTALTGNIQTAVKKALFIPMDC